MHFACDTCGEDFPNNNDLYKHVKSKHVILCHICRNTFVSQIQLQDHLDEVHDQQRAKSREEMIDKEWAEEHKNKEKQKQEKKKKKKKRKKARIEDDDDDDEEDDSTYHPSQDYGDDSQEDPEWVPSKCALRQADEEGDEDDE